MGVRGTMEPTVPLNSLQSNESEGGRTGGVFSLDEREQELKISEIPSCINVIAHDDPDISIYAHKGLWTNLRRGWGSKPR